ncbi:MAG: beta-xylosidase, partial [Mesorhizobium sp.]
AAFIVKTVLEANTLVEGYSYWTFSDLFEENYFPSVPFQGGFGLMTIQGIAKPSFRAYQLLHGLGTEMLPVGGSHETVDAWLVRGERGATLMLTNFALPRHDIGDEKVSFTMTCTEPMTKATIQRIDVDHANAKRRWELLGKPKYPNGENLAALNEASQLEEEAIAFTMDGHVLKLDLIIPPQAVAAIRFSF